MSHPNTDRDENINLIRARQRARPKHGTIAHLEAVEDIQYLLSLLDSQADDKEFAARTPIGIQIATNAATRMRDACVEKVRELRVQWHDSYVAADTSSKEALVRKELLFAQCQAANKIITALQSLTLEGEEKR